MRIETGIDIIEVARIEKKMEANPKLLNTVFTDFELEQTRGLKMRYQTLSGKWAAKEAFAKALGTGFSEQLGWRDIEIRNDIDQKPVIKILNDELSGRFHIEQISLSITHTKEFAAASVVIVFDD